MERCSRIDVTFGNGLGLNKAVVRLLHDKVKTLECRYLGRL